MKLPVWCRVGGYRPEPLSRLRASVAPAGGSRWINRIVAAGILICFGAIGSAAEPNRAADRTRLHAYLEAGEFGPSFRLALAQPSAAGRNAMIAQIAVAQARAGAASAALVTLGELRDETLLRQTTAAPGRAWLRRHEYYCPGGRQCRDRTGGFDPGNRPR